MGNIHHDQKWKFSDMIPLVFGADYGYVSNFFGTDRCDLVMVSFPAGPVTGIRFTAAMIVV